MNRHWNNLLCRLGYHRYAPRRYHAQSHLECYRSDYCRGRHHHLYGWSV